MGRQQRFDLQAEKRHLNYNSLTLKEIGARRRHFSRAILRLSQERYEPYNYQSPFLEKGKLPFPLRSPPHTPHPSAPILFGPTHVDTISNKGGGFRINSKIRSIIDLRLLCARISVHRDGKDFKFLVCSFVPFSSLDCIFVPRHLISPFTFVCMSLSIPLSNKLTHIKTKYHLPSPTCLGVYSGNKRDPFCSLLIGDRN